MKLKVTGLKELQKGINERLADFPNDVKRVVKQNGNELQRKMQGNADFHGHYEYEAGVGRVFKKPTGKTKESIGLEIKHAGLTAEVAPTTEYAQYVEYGTRFMDAQPFVRPAYDEQLPQFKKDMQRLVK